LAEDKTTLKMDILVMEHLFYHQNISRVSLTFLFGCDARARVSENGKSLTACVAAL
jgi:hypothetical protein